MRSESEYRNGWNQDNRNEGVKGTQESMLGSPTSLWLKAGLFISAGELQNQEVTNDIA